MDYRRPKSQHVSYDDSPELYQAEGKAAAANREVAKLRTEMLDADPDEDLWTVGYPQAIYDLLDSIDEKSVRIAIAAWLEDHPE